MMISRVTSSAFGPLLQPVGLRRVTASRFNPLWAHNSRLWITSITIFVVIVAVVFDPVATTTEIEDYVDGKRLQSSSKVMWLY